MKIEVTKEDIDAYFARQALRFPNYRPLVSRTCPVANAFKRLVPDAISVSCGTDHIAIWKKDKSYLGFIFPQDVENIIKLFDRTNKMEPFEFEATEEVVV